MGTCLEISCWVYPWEWHTWVWIGIHVVGSVYNFDGFDNQVTWECLPARSGCPPLFSAPLVLAPLHSWPPEKWEGSEINDSLQESCAQLSIQMLWHDSQSYKKPSQVAQLMTFSSQLGNLTFFTKPCIFQEYLSPQSWFAAEPDG